MKNIASFCFLFLLHFTNASYGSSDKEPSQLGEFLPPVVPVKLHLPAELVAVEELRKRAEQNDAISQYNLARKLLYGEGVVKDPLEATYWFEKAANNNLRSAQTVLGIIYLDGGVVQKDRHRAHFWLKKSAENGDPIAMSSLGALLIDENEIPYDLESGYGWLRKSALLANSDAATQLAYHLLLNDYKPEWTESKQEGLSWLRQEIDNGNTKACYLLLVSPVVTRTEIDIDLRRKAVEVLEKPESKSDPIAWYALYIAYSTGHAVDINRVRALKSLQRAAEGGLGIAQLQFAIIELSDASNNADKAQAASLIKSLSKQGFREASAALGYMYFVGNYVPINKGEGVRLLREAAAGGSFTALGRLIGICVEKSDQLVSEAECLDWIMRGAAAGLPGAMILMAVHGAMENDHEAAYKWILIFEKVSEFGFGFMAEEIDASLQEMKKMMAALRVDIESKISKRIRQRIAEDVANWSPAIQSTDGFENPFNFAGQMPNLSVDSLLEITTTNQ